MNTSLWPKLAEERRERLRKVVDDPKYENVFNENFFAGIEQRKTDAAARGRKVQVVQGSILLLLMFALFVPSAHVSFLGLGGEVRHLREALHRHGVRPDEFVVPKFGQTILLQRSPT